MEQQGTSGLVSDHSNNQHHHPISQPQNATPCPSTSTGGTATSPPFLIRCNGMESLDKEDDSSGDDTIQNPVGNIGNMGNLNIPNVGNIPNISNISNIQSSLISTTTTAMNTINNNNIQTPSPARSDSILAISTESEENAQNAVSNDVTITSPNETTINGQRNILTRPNTGIEVSVVGSPEVFGHHTPATLTPESDDERIIERCDVLNQNNPSIASGETLCLPTSDPRPPKKRFMQMPDLPRSRTLHQQPSAFVEPHKAILIPNGQHFQDAMNRWDWHKIDGFSMPVVLRGPQRYAAVNIVQSKLLSKFPSNIPAEMANKFQMLSHKMTPIEAWIFNSINSVITKFDLGFHLFTANDEIVLINDVERFYWSVKEWNMKSMIERYNTELTQTTSTHLMAVITKIRNNVQDVIQVMEKSTADVQNANNTTAPSLTPQNSLMS